MALRKTGAEAVAGEDRGVVAICLTKRGAIAPGSPVPSAGVVGDLFPAGWGPVDSMPGGWRTSFFLSLLSLPLDLSLILDSLLLSPLWAGQPKGVILPKGWEGVYIKPET